MRSVGERVLENKGRSGLEAANTLEAQSFHGQQAWRYLLSCLARRRILQGREYRTSRSAPRVQAFGYRGVREKYFEKYSEKYFEQFAEKCFEKTRIHQLL
jgi:hypothetical protein